MMSDHKSEECADYAVGYRKPPEQHRFQPGQSGNPNGKPEGRGNLLDAFKQIACKKIKVRVGDSTRWMTIAEAVLVKYWQLAINGDQKALYNILPLADELASLPDRSENDQLAWLLTPEGKIPDWFKPSYDRLTALLAERRELRAELRRHQRMRAEKRRLNAQSENARDPLA